MKKLVKTFTVIVMAMALLTLISWGKSSGDLAGQSQDETVKEVSAINQEVAKAGQASVEVLPPAYDFGDIIQSEGAVSTIFTVTNVSGEVITINRLSTSCGCTTAEMSDNPLEPGEQREMTVTFDPLVHPDQFGEIERVVYLQTSDPVNPEIEIDLHGNVIE